MSICKNLLVAVPNRAIVAIAAIVAQDKVAQDIKLKLLAMEPERDHLGSLEPVFKLIDEGRKNGLEDHKVVDRLLEKCHDQMVQYMKKEELTDVQIATEEFFECYIMSNTYKERHAGEKAAMMKGPINDESKPVETEPIT